MKIGLDVRLWRASTGGIGRYSRNLLKELLRLDLENHYVAILTPEDEKEFTLSAENLSKLVVDIPHFSFSEQRNLVGVLEKEHFDLVHFCNFNHPIRYHRPFVVTVHDLIMHLYPMGAQRKSPLRRWACKTVMNDCRRAEQVIVPSQATKKDLVTMLNFPSEKITVTEEGSEESFFRLHSEAEKKAIKEKFGLPERYLLFVSRWERYKGLPALLEAFEQLSKKYPDLGLVISGKPDKQSPDVAQAVRAAQQERKNVFTPGFVSDEELAALYSAATVYVHPSWYEGFGIMILEAFASGVPVVTSNISSLPEVVGDAGLLVNPRDPNRLAKEISRLLDDRELAARLVKKGFERVKRYSWKRMAEETLAIYRKILG